MEGMPQKVREEAAAAIHEAATGAAHEPAIEIPLEVEREASAVIDKAATQETHEEDPRTIEQLQVRMDSLRALRAPLVESLKAKLKVLSEDFVGPISPAELDFKTIGAEIQNMSFEMAALDKAITKKRNVAQ